MSTQNQRTYKKMVWLAVGSFGFAFAMVPMYNIACEKVFGIKLDKTASAAPKAGAARIDEQRTVQVYFDGTVNSKLPWSLRAESSEHERGAGQACMKPRTAPATPRLLPVVGNAAPSIAPNQYSSFFNKTECFCFTEQALAGRRKQGHAGAFHRQSGFAEGNHHADAFIYLFHQ